MRRSALLAVVALSLASCSATGELTARGALPSPADAAEDVVARSTIVRFLEAYERVPLDGGAALIDLAGSPAVGHWAAWLGVQYRQLGDRVESGHVLREIGPLRPAETVGGAQARVVMISAEVVFVITPESGSPQQHSRSLDGPMVLVNDENEGWRVTDFTRDGVLLSHSVHVFPLGSGVRERGVTIAVDSFIADQDQWAIGVVIRNGTERSIGVEPDLVGVYDITASPVNAGITPDSLSEIGPGQNVEALVAYPIPEAEDPLGLRLVIGARITGDDRLVVLDVPVRPVLRMLERAGTASPSPSPAGSA
jgi:hypothetical protein